MNSIHRERAVLGRAADYAFPAIRMSWQMVAGSSFIVPDQRFTLLAAFLRIRL
jgi:hypothetical protein